MILGHTTDQHQCMLQHTIVTYSVTFGDISSYDNSNIFYLQEYVLFPSAAITLSTLHFIATVLVRRGILQPYPLHEVSVESESYFVCIRPLAPPVTFNSQPPTHAVWLHVINIHHHKNFTTQIWFPIRFKLIFYVLTCYPSGTLLARYCQDDKIKDGRGMQLAWRGTKCVKISAGKSEGNRSA